jgi:hypothetical protein
MNLGNMQQITSYFRVVSKERHQLTVAMAMQLRVKGNKLIEVGYCRKNLYNLKLERQIGLHLSLGDERRQMKQDI